MPSQPSSASEDRLLVCNCFKTMDLSDSGNALGNRLAAPVCSQLCRDEIGLFESAIADGQPFAVACTQEAPLFREIAEEADASDRVRFFNIRETAGWSETQENLTPKILALTAEADLQALQRPAPAKTLSSDGLCMIYGAGQAALDAALALEGILSVTLVLTSTDDVLLPPVLPFPIFCGHIRSLEGALGGFQVVLDGYAPMLPSSRRTPEFLLPKDGARSSCSVVIDLSGHTAPVTAPHKRDGYLRADPADPLAVSRVLHTAGELIGDFEKPVYVAYQSDICAHSHAGKTGCSKCLDACPAGAIHSLGTMIEVDPAICGGCGSCAVVCPTGAISYQYPYRDDLIDRVQALAGTFLNASGSHPELLIHSMDHGFNLISALARYGNGLPAHVLPLGLHTVTSFGHEAMITAFLAGFQRIFILADPKDAEELAALTFEMEMVRALLTGMGHSAEHRLTILTENDPDRLENALAANSPLPLGHQPARIAPKGSKRDVARLAITTLRTLSDTQPDVIDLPPSAPYGQVTVDTDGCTLCMACVSSCPAGALTDNPDKPQLSFIESACVQCGLCKATCPEKVITLNPRLNLTGAAIRPSVLNEEDPAICTSCGKAFGTRSTIERIKKQLAGKHHMFQSAAQSNLIDMCDDCRINAQWAADDGLSFAQGAAVTPSRPRLRTTDDYLEADRHGLSVDDFLKDN